MDHSMSILQTWRRYLRLDDPDKPDRDRETCRLKRVTQAFALNRYDINELREKYERAKENSALDIELSEDGSSFLSLYYEDYGLACSIDCSGIDSVALDSRVTSVLNAIVEFDNVIQVLFEMEHARIGGCAEGFMMDLAHANLEGTKLTLEYSAAFVNNSWDAILIQDSFGKFLPQNFAVS
jgi:hypothetical protein